MLLLWLALSANAEDDRTPCERIAHTPRYLSGVRALVKPDCRAERSRSPETFEKGLCRNSRMVLILPDPYVAEQMKIDFVESRREMRLKERDNPQGRQKIGAHNNWLETGQTIELGLSSGRTLTLPLQERSQARTYFNDGGRERLKWTVRVALPAADARALLDDEVASWGFTAPGLSVFHPVKVIRKRARFAQAVACLL